MSGEVLQRPEVGDRVVIRGQAVVVEQVGDCPGGWRVKVRGRGGRAFWAKYPYEGRQHAPEVGGER